jgi:type IV secretion system protein VirD4
MKSRVRIGYWDRSFRQKLYFPHDSNLILVAPAGSGKWRDVLSAIALEWGFSLIWIDPKAQGVSVVGRHRQKRLKQRLVILNPFDILPQYLGDFGTAHYNPLETLNPALDSFGADCESMADAIVTEETRGVEGNHWSLSAKNLFAGIIAALLKHGLDKDKNLAAVRRLICGPELVAFCREAMKIDDDFIRENLGRFAALGAEDNKELLGMISTAITQSSFIGNKAIADSLSHSTFSFRGLKKRRTSVFLTLPARYLSTCSKWFRLIIAAALHELLQEERGVPVLIVLDEFAQLGRLKSIENAMALSRGYGVQLLPVLQDLNQLRVYENTWETFLANAGCRIFFAPRDKFTSEHLSALCGDSEIRDVSKSVNPNAGGGISINPRTRRYLLPHEVRELPGDEMLIFGEGIPGVIRAGRRPYYRSPEFEGMYDVDPYHAETMEGFEDE